MTTRSTGSPRKRAPGELYVIPNIKFTEIEQKVIFLKAINESIDLRMLRSWTE